MPTICHFYGIIIVMYLRNKEHNPPHIHAITQDFDAPFLISTGEISAGIADDVGDRAVYQAAASGLSSLSNRR
jgi:hypothetical protein